MSAAFDCRSCGACCREAGDVTVYPSDSTPKHLTRSVRGRVGYASFEADEFRCMARVEGRCIALRGEIGVAVHCATYGRRPAVCRDFVPGSPGCLASRERVAQCKARAAEEPCMLPRGYGPFPPLPSSTVEAGR